MLPSNPSAFSRIESRSDKDQKTMSDGKEAAPDTITTTESKPSTIAPLSSGLVDTFRECNPSYEYDTAKAPVRILTKLSTPDGNDGFDNANADLIVSVGDVLMSALGTSYTVQDLLGHGTFGQVFKCKRRDTNEDVAIKVIKNQPAYYHQARVEIGVLQFLNTRADPNDHHCIVRLLDFFLHKNHLCLVFELLGMNLYEIIKHNKFKGLSLPLVRVFISQMLVALNVLRKSRIVHCDLKPENILLKNSTGADVKLIDFGSACFESKTVYSYIQSRFYRSPEVVIGHPYGMSIDMWSLGCVAAELFLGLPLFPGASEHDLLSRIEATVGPLTTDLLAKGRHTAKFYQEDPIKGHTLKTRVTFEVTTGQKAAVGKTYFPQIALADIISARAFRSGLSDSEVSLERKLREAFTDFLLGVLDLDPRTRWTPLQASTHPFITGVAFNGPFQPVADPSQQTERCIGPPTQGVDIPRGPSQPPLAIASSPHVSAAAHAQAHVAAMAAVQMQMSLRQQQQQVPSYNVQQEQQQHLFGSYNLMLSPPSRSFGTHLRVDQHDSSKLAALDATALTPKGGVLPLLGTTFQQQSMAFSPRSFSGYHYPHQSQNHYSQSLMGTSFQPASIHTYQAALAAVYNHQLLSSSVGRNTSGFNSQVMPPPFEQRPAHPQNNNVVKWNSMDSSRDATPRKTPNEEPQTGAEWDPLFVADDLKEEDNLTHGRTVSLPQPENGRQQPWLRGNVDTSGVPLSPSNSTASMIWSPSRQQAVTMAVGQEHSVATKASEPRQRLQGFNVAGASGSDNSN